MKRQLNATEARQARLGRPVLYVLLAGVAIAVVAMTLVWFASDDDPGDAEIEGAALTRTVALAAVSRP